MNVSYLYRIDKQAYELIRLDQLYRASVFILCIFWSFQKQNREGGENKTTDQAIYPRL